MISPTFATISLTTDGNVLVPYSYRAPNFSIYAVNPSYVDTNDPIYPQPDNFLNSSTNFYCYGSISPVVLPDNTICIGVIFSLDSSNAPQLLTQSAFGVNGLGGVKESDMSLKWAFCNNSTKLFGSICVGNDGAYYTSSGGYVYSFTNADSYIGGFTNNEGYTFYLKNVQLKWKYRADNGELSNTFQDAKLVVGGDGTIYVYSTYYSGLLYAFNPTNGVLKWKTSSGGINNRYASIAIGNDGTIYLPENNYLAAVNPSAPITNGIMSFKWTYTDTNYSSSYFPYSPVVGLDGTVYVEYEGFTSSWLYNTNRFAALNPKNGVVKWAKWIGSNNSYYGDNFKNGSLAVACDGEIYLADSDGILYSFDPNGNVNWSYDTGGSQALGSPMIAPDGTLYVESLDGGGYNCVLYAFQTPCGVACSSWPEDGRNARRFPTVTTASVSSPTKTTNGFQIGINCYTNFPVCVFSSSDFINWTNLGQIVLTGGNANFVDIGATTNYPYRFYRAMPQ
jgi:PQQ-like domain